MLNVLSLLLLMKVRRQSIACHRFVLAQRCRYFRTMFAESSSAAPQTVALDFHSAQELSSFQHLLTFIYTDSCPLLAAECAAECSNVRACATDSSGNSEKKRKTNFRETTEEACDRCGVDSITSLKTMARQFGVTTLVKR